MRFDPDKNKALVAADDRGAFAVFHEHFRSQPLIVAVAPEQANGSVTCGWLELNPAHGWQSFEACHPDVRQQVLERWLRLHTRTGSPCGAGIRLEACLGCAGFSFQEFFDFNPLLARAKMLSGGCT